jgi:hypothetical protein
MTHLMIQQRREKRLIFGPSKLPSNPNTLAQHIARSKNSLLLSRTPEYTIEWQLWMIREVFHTELIPDALKEPYIKRDSVRGDTRNRYTYQSPRHTR